jgi:hypothetical protein
MEVSLGAGLEQTLTPVSIFEAGEVRAHSRNVIPRLGYLRPLGKRVDLEVGADGEVAQYRPHVPSMPNELADFTRQRDTRVVGVHGSLVLRLGERLILTPGLRFDSYGDGQAHRTDLGPRVAARLRVGETTWLKASGGRFTQMPSLPLQLPAYEGFGLARHGLQTSWQGAVGVEATPRPGLDVDASTFVQRGVLTDMRDPQIGDSLLNDFFIRREALAYGLELMVRRPSTARLYGWLSYTLSWSLRGFEGGVVGASDWDQRHVLNLVVGYRLGRYTLGGRFHVNTGRPVQVGNTSPIEFARLPAFYQLDLRVDRRFVLDRFVIDLYLELVNSTLTPQVTGLVQTERGLERNSTRIVLPSLGVRAEF